MRFAKLLLVICLVAGASTFGDSEAYPPTPEIAPHFGCDEPTSDLRFYPETRDPDEMRAFVERDNANQACAMQRGEDQFRNQTLHALYLEKTPAQYPEHVSDRTSEPNRPRASVAELVPGMRQGDPFRDPIDWQSSGRGRFFPISFIARKTGAELEGSIFLPPPSLPGPYPGVIISTGASQQHKETYYWAAEGLAEEGYMVLTFDFQAQGGSEKANHDASGGFCTKISCVEDLGWSDNQADAHFFYDQMRDAIDFMFSDPATPYGIPVPNYVGTNMHNPHWSDLDRQKVGLAGHSVGAVVASDVGQLDQRIQAIVRWGYTGFVNVPYIPGIHAPTLIVADDYGPKGPQPWYTLPPAYAQEVGYLQIYDQRVPAMLVSLRSSTHYEWTWAGGRYASRYGERVSFYYTLAWFDAYLKGRTDDAKRQHAYDRLTALTFDDSADVHSIGAGTYELDATSGTFVNKPYKIEGICVRDRLSFIFRSRYWLAGGGYETDNMRARGCPAS